MVDTLAHTLKLTWRLRRLQPDVVHTNSLKSGIYGSIAARLARIPVLWHVRDRIDADYLPVPAVHLVRTLTRYVPDMVVCNSEATKRTLRPRERSLVISLVDLVATPWRPAATHNGSLVVGIVGRLTPWKGQDVFLRAFAQAFPDGTQRAVIVGAALFGEEEVAYAEGLRHMAEELGITGRVEFRGHRDDMAEELLMMDILVHASIIPEPFGQVVVVGMSAELPVVASRGGGPEEIITDDVDGLLHPPGDIAALAQILTRLAAEPQLRAHLGHAAGLRAKDFAPDLVAERMMRAYDLAQRAAHQ